MKPRFLATMVAGGTALALGGIGCNGGAEGTGFGNTDSGNSGAGMTNASQAGSGNADSGDTEAGGANTGDTSSDGGHLLGADASAASAVDAAMNQCLADASVADASAPSDSWLCDYLPTDGPLMRGRYQGHYYPGTYIPAFTPCGSAEIWDAAYFGPDFLGSVYAILPHECETTMTPSHELCTVYLDVEAHVVSLGIYYPQVGPMYDRSMAIDHVYTMKVAAVDDCTASP